MALYLGSSKIASLHLGQSEQIAYEEGKQAEYDRFWDAYQQNGNKQTYTSTFCGESWTPETFVPKYDVVPVTSATHLFGQKALMGCDLDEIAANVGVRIDFSKSSHLSEVFFYSGIAKVGVFDTRNAATVHNTFAYATLLETIRLLILKEDGSQSFNDASFRNCVKLSDITIAGKIGFSINFQWSTLLSKDSIVSIANALSTTVSGNTLTLSQTAVNNAFETSEGAADGSTSDEWTALIDSKSNWTIILV